MGNINFSADMVGIQTLAQQGKSPVQDGEAMAMGSFEDMIMQLIADNMTVLPEQEVISTEDKEEAKNVVLDAILNGMISPEMQVFVADNVLTENDVIEVSAIQSNVLNAVIQPQVSQMQHAEINPDVIVADVIMQDNANSNVNVSVNENTLFTDIVQTSITEVVQNTSDDVAGVIETTDVAIDNNIQVETELIQQNKETTNVESMSFNENQPQENELAESKESFISTEDMLMMRAGNKIDFSADKAVFKVAEVPVNIEAPTAAADLADKILMKFNENEFEVELYPKNLGKITVSLTVEDGIVNVVLNSTNDKVNEFLASQSANIQNIVEKNTQYQAIVKLDDSQEQYQQQRDNAQHGADENQKNRQQEHLQQMYSQNVQQTTEDFLSMLRFV